MFTRNVDLSSESNEYEVVPPAPKEYDEAAITKALAYLNAPHPMTYTPWHRH